jgi:uncharacterized membrane protein
MVFYPELPGTMPIHWNMAGTADSFAPKAQALFIFPGIALAMLALFQFLPKIDPKKENYPKFEKTWEIIQFALLVFFAYVYGLVIWASLDPGMNMNRYAMLGIGTLFVILGNYMGKIRRNYFVGYKLPWTIDNDEVWNKTHRLGGKMFMLGGAAFIANAFLNLYLAAMTVVIVGVILVVPVVYSYVIFRKIRK